MKNINIQKYLNKRNLINALGLIAFALGLAMQEGLIVCENYVKWATFTISLIGYITNTANNDVKTYEVDHNGY